jgi:tetratricopeptide (TPR) repeat protein
MRTFDLSDFIERYNAGEMSDSQKMWFEKELEGNYKLQNEVNLRKHTDEILENQNIISLRNKLSIIGKRREADIQYQRSEVGIQYKSNKADIQYNGRETDVQYNGRETDVQYRKSKMPVYMKYVAVMAGVILIGSFTLFSGKHLTSDQIVNRYYKVYEPPTTQRSGQTETNSDFTKALAFYNIRDYREAAILFSKVVERNPKDMQSELLIGVSNFGDKKYVEAKQSYVKVINDNNNLFIETAKWYLALCYVQTKEREKAIQQLETIKKEDGIYSNDAKKIIKRYK